MKEIKAFVKPFKVNDILNQLLQAGYPNITVSMAEGTGNFKSEDSSLSTHFSITDSKVAKIEISTFGRTGNHGDGIIFVAEVEKVYKVKTGMENGDD